MKRRGCPHFSGWVRIPRAVILFLSGKCFGFLMLFCRLAPARPSLRGPHVCTHTHSPMHSAALSALPCWGLGMAAPPFQHLQNKNEVGQGADTQPEAVLSAQEQNAFPGRALNPRGWVGHRGRKLDSELLLFLCTPMSSHSLTPGRGWPNIPFSLG